MDQALTCPPGTTLFRPGQPCPGFVVLDKGTIRVSLTAANGREVVLYRVGPGEICLQTFTCLTRDRTYTAEGVAETALSGRLIPPSDFRNKLATDPPFRDRVFDAVAQRFADYEQLVEDIALTGFDARLARVLLRLRDAQDRVHATHEQLAAETASGRAFVSRRLAEFQRAQLVSLARGEVALRDVPGLDRIATEQR
jgi:CRP/FNR family transcriptional regulator